MDNNTWKLVFNPFVRIAGGTTLGLGLLGLFLSAVLNYFSGSHYSGLLHYGPATNLPFYHLLLEQLVVWLVPATLFYIGGVCLSKSRIRAIDVYGTVAFSLLPLVVCNISYFLPILDAFKDIPHNSSPLAIEINSDLIVVALYGLALMFFVVWMLIWLFQALKVTCNLKGGRLWAVYLIGVIGGDVICRLLIGLLY